MGLAPENATRVCADPDCEPCVAQLSSPAARWDALKRALEGEREPLIALTHVLHLCRDEHKVLWERISEPGSRDAIEEVAESLGRVLPAGVNRETLDRPVRKAMAGALEPSDGVAPVVVAYAIAQFLDERYAHTFTESFRRRSPYQPGFGDPVPLGNPDLTAIMDMRPTAPPWRLANRLDETRRIRLAGEWAVRFRVVFDYALHETLAGVVTADTIIATCHPNRSLDDFVVPQNLFQPVFPVQVADPDRQREQINRQISAAAAAGASIVVLPELCVTEAQALELEDWVRRPGGLQLLVAGSYHHENEHGPDHLPHRRRNTAIGWVRGHDQPLTHDKHSPADRPVIEDIQPDGWPELRVYVTADGWHLVIAICRDLLNPQAVHALTEAGANLVLVPAMSETLVPFGGPAAQLVSADQALVAVANNPATWSDGTGPGTRQPARALFGHPGFGQQTRLVQAPDGELGVALLSVSSGQLRWQPTEETAPTDHPGKSPPPSTPTPRWVTHLTQELSLPGTRPRAQREQWRPAAVLVLISQGPTGQSVLLTRRSADLSEYPGQLVFPGGATDPLDDGPVATALREAAEEVGLDPDSVGIVGNLPTIALPDSGFLVTPVLAWSARPRFSGSVNVAEVATISEVALGDLARWAAGRRPFPADGAQLDGDGVPESSNPDLKGVGRMTATVIDLLLAAHGRSGHQQLGEISTPPRGTGPVSPRHGT